MKVMPLRRPLRAFTLIELLTVIAIVGILAAIIIPVVAAVRSNASQARDLNRVRTLVTASLGFAADNRGILPNVNIPIPGTNIGQGNRWTYGEAIERYLPAPVGATSNSIYNWKNNDVWYAEATRAPSSWTPNPTYPNVTRPAGFGRNIHIAPSTLGQSNPWMGYLSRVPNPARTILIAEILNDSLVVIPSAAPQTKNDVDATYRVSRDGASIYGFVDGHVALLKGDLSEPALAASGQTNLWRWW